MLLKYITVQFLLVAGVSALLGYASAQGKLNPLQKAEARPAEQAKARVSAAPTAPGCCSGCLNKAGVLAPTNHNEAAADKAAAKGKKPNVVYFLVDNLGYGELGCYGGGVLHGTKTSRMDKFTAQGMMLLNFASESQCALLILFAINTLALAENGDEPKKDADAFKITTAENGDEPKKDADAFKITTRRTDDAVEVQSDKDKTVFDVKSPFGIGQAVIERQDENWPKAVVLRLHLKGLSSFRVENGKVRLDAAVSIEEGKTKVRMWKDGNEDAALDKQSPLWMDVCIVGGDGKPAQELPLKDGYFELKLPQAFFEGKPESITLNWIDFYRQ